MNLISKQEIRKFDNLSNAMIPSWRDHFFQLQMVKSVITINNVTKKKKNWKPYHNVFSKYTLPLLVNSQQVRIL